MSNFIHNHPKCVRFSLKIMRVVNKKKYPKKILIINFFFQGFIEVEKKEPKGKKK